jgi:predicted permease
VIFGIAPALGLTSTLHSGAKASGNLQARRTRGLLVVAECAVAIVLLTGAGLLLRSLNQLRSVNPGFDPGGVLAVRLEFPPEQLSGAASQGTEKDRATRRYAIASDLERRVAAIPGVRTVGYMDDLFLAGSGHAVVTIPGQADLGNSVELTDAVVTPGFFETLRVPLVRGRYLTDADAATKIEALWAPVNNSGSLAEREARAVFEPVVVNVEFARRFFPGQNPVGKRFCIDPTNKTYWYVIVGVIGDMRRQGLAKNAIAQYYGPWVPMPSGRADLLVRATTDPLTITDAVRRVVREAVPGAIVADVSTVDSQLGAFHAQRDLQAKLLSIFAALAIGLAAIGIYGVVHYTVAERTRELGIRIALGATPARIRGLVLREGMRGPLIGVAIGLGAALAVTRVLSSALYGITPTDPMTYVGVTLLLLAVACVACLVPAVRATKVNPITALRRE